MDEQKNTTTTSLDEPITTTPESNDDTFTTSEQTDAPSEPLPSSDTFTPTTNNAISEHSPTTTNRNALFFVAVAVLVLAVVAGGYFFLNQNSGIDLTTPVNATLSEAEAAEPVAIVNGVTITRGQLSENINQVNDQARQGGFDVSDPSVIAQIETEAYTISINNELLRQAATASVERPTDEVVDAELQKIITENGGKEAFTRLLTEYGFTEETLRKNITDSLHIQAYLATKITPAEVTEAEIKAFYESIGGEAAGLPPLDDAVREQIEAQLILTKQQAAVGAVIEELRAEATIEKIS